MKPRIAALLLTALALLAACGKEAPPELAGTVWTLDNEHDANYYGAHVVYTMAFGQQDDVSFDRSIDGSAIAMHGTYSYADGKGQCTLRSDGDATDYPMTFSVSGSDLDLRYASHSITLARQ